MSTQKGKTVIHKYDFHVIYLYCYSKRFILPSFDASTIFMFDNFVFLKVGAKDLMDIGDIIFLPTTIDVKSRSTKHENENLCNEEMKFIRGLELFKVLISVNCFSSICCQMLKFL